MQNFQALAESNFVTATNKSSAAASARRPEGGEIMRVLNIMETPQNLSEDSILQRMPKDYFVPEVEHTNVDAVINDIKEMRQGLFEYMEENNISADLGDISHIL